MQATGFDNHVETKYPVTYYLKFTSSLNNNSEISFKFWQEMNKTEVKEALKASTQDALNEGAFGLPFIVVHHSKTSVETFFGSDRFEILADRLRLKWLGP